MGSEQIALVSRGVSTDTYRNVIKTIIDQQIFYFGGALGGGFATYGLETIGLDTELFPGFSVAQALVSGIGLAEIVMFFFNVKILAADRIGLAVGSGLISGALVGGALNDVIPSAGEEAFGTTARAVARLARI